MKTVKIGSKPINTNVFLAPLAGCSDLSFRLICREYGAKFAFFEMIDANSLIYNRIRSLRLIKTIKEDEPIAGQLLGRDPQILLEAALRLIDSVSISFLDINCACPVRKVVKKKCGAYLLNDLDGLSKLIKKLAGNLSVPITAKLRIGYLDKNKKQITEVAKTCEGSGASALFVHGRTKRQMYSGDVDYNLIRAVKEAVNIPVFGSGNVLTPHLAKKMFDETNCDGILVARGALGRPWMARDIMDYMEGKSTAAINMTERKTALKRHLVYFRKYKEVKDTIKVGFMRKIALWYLRDFTECARTRGKICRINNYDELLQLIDSLPDD
ncbi:MAG: tRNA dihydrouridine synthase DusB [Candidatus Omnitrophica bacterium]|nr:tRNA dihydrouridine synthase DusB [Candidatus Omnitrophota bacterium]